MGNQNETGHAKNVANFGTLIMTVEALGPTYNPSRTTITLVALQEKKSAADELLAVVNSKLGTYNKAIADRESLFEPFGRLITRVINSLRASEASPAMISSVESIVRKLQGRRASSPATPSESTTEAGTTSGKISSSQMSFDSRIQNFDRLIQLLANIPEYNPNEEDLKLASLTSYYQAFQEVNAIAVAAAGSLANARIERDGILYSPGTGLVDVALSVKSYIKSLYGATSPQYKQVSGLLFRSVKK